MIFNDIMVRADFVGGQGGNTVVSIVPLCFQVASDKPCCHIGRVIDVVDRPQSNTIKYRCRLSKSDDVVTLVLDTSDDSYRWSVDMDEDLVKASTPSVSAEKLVIKPASKKDADNIREEIGSEDLAMWGGLTLGCGVLWSLVKFFFEPKTMQGDYFFKMMMFVYTTFFAFSGFGLLLVLGLFIKHKLQRKG